MWIQEIEIDDDNVGHLTSHGVAITEIEAVFASHPTVRRNKSGRAADYYAIANRIRSTSSTDQVWHDRSAPGGYEHEREVERVH